MKLSADPITGTPWNTPSTLLLGAIFFLLTLFLYTRANTFSAEYHPDEACKAKQVMQNEYNFHHPMLMLSVAKIALKGSAAGDSVQRTTITGRWVSAFFTAAAIFCLTLMVSELYGTFAAAAAGLLLAANTQIFELAHYFKEDPALLFGMSTLFLAFALYDRSQSLPHLVFLGIATGLAISGKYVGALAAPAAAVLLVLAPGGRRIWWNLLVWIGVTVLVFALVNLPLFLNPAGFTSGFERELGFAISGHKGITRSVPHGVYGAVFREATNPVIWILLIVFAFGIVFRAGRARRSEWILALFPICFAIVLSFSPKTHHRYFLPDTALLLAAAAGGICMLPRFRWNGRLISGGTSPILLCSSVLLIALATGAPKFVSVFNGFQNDGRNVLARYLREHAAVGSTVIQDTKVNLEALDLPLHVENGTFAADAGSLDDLRSRGIVYVAVAEGSYGRFFSDHLKPTSDGAADYKRRHAFYEQLFKEGNLVFECKAGTLQYLQPHLELYRIQ